jgi:hypothetical protein
MALEPKLNDGESFVKGRSTAKARELVEAAKAAGLPDGSVVTVSHGYVVPSSLVEGGDAITAADQPAVLTEPGTSTNPDEVHNVGQSPEGTDALQEATEAEADKNAEESRVDGTEAETADEDLTAYNPADHTVDEVKEYLEGVDDEEFARVIAAEQESAKPRKGILDLAATEGE